MSKRDEIARVIDNGICECKACKARRNGKADAILAILADPDARMVEAADAAYTAALHQGGGKAWRAAIRAAIKAAGE